MYATKKDWTRIKLFAKMCHSSRHFYALTYLSEWRTFCLLTGSAKIEMSDKVKHSSLFHQSAYYLLQKALCDLFLAELLKAERGEELARRFSENTLRQRKER
jgi:hypothetical protein